MIADSSELSLLGVSSHDVFGASKDIVSTGLLQIGMTLQSPIPELSHEDDSLSHDTGSMHGSSLLSIQATGTSSRVRHDTHKAHAVPELMAGRHSAAHSIASAQSQHSIPSVSSFGSMHDSLSPHSHHNTEDDSHNNSNDIDFDVSPPRPSSH